MPREIDILGVYVPSLLIALLATMPVYWLLDVLLAKLGVYRWVWHIDLFRLGVFVVMFTVWGNYLYR
jgi:hypothetical protein